MDTTIFDFKMMKMQSVRDAAAREDASDVETRIQMSATFLVKVRDTPVSGVAIHRHVTPSSHSLFLAINGVSFE